VGEQGKSVKWSGNCLFGNFGFAGLGSQRFVCSATEVFASLDLVDLNRKLVSMAMIVSG